MSTLKRLTVFLVSLGLLFGGSRPVSAQGGHVEESSLARRMFQIGRVSRYVQPRAQAFKCQVSSLHVGVSAPVIVLQHAPVVNLSCGWNDKDNTAYRYSSSGLNYRQYKPTISTFIDGGAVISFKKATEAFSQVRSRTLYRRSGPINLSLQLF
jgi:hypothetical protein